MIRFAMILLSLASVASDANEISPAASGKNQALPVPCVVMTNPIPIASRNAEQLDTWDEIARNYCYNWTEDGVEHARSRIMGFSVDATGKIVRTQVNPSCYDSTAEAEADLKKLRAAGVCQPLVAPAK